LVDETLLRKKHANISEGGKKQTGVFGTLKENPNAVKLK
jgi:hypothetical protein